MLYKLLRKKDFLMPKKTEENKIKPSNTNIKIVTAIIAIVGVCLFSINMLSPNKYSDYTSDHPYEALKANDNLDKINYMVVYKQGCDHCAKAESAIVQNLKLLKKRHVPFTVTNAKDAPSNVITFLQSKNVTETPTIVVQYKKWELYSYTGTSNQIITSILSGINPDTLQTFKAEKPKTTTYKNDLTKTFEKMPVSDPD